MSGTQGMGMWQGGAACHKGRVKVATVGRLLRVSRAPAGGQRGANRSWAVIAHRAYPTHQSSSVFSRSRKLGREKACCSTRESSALTDRRRALLFTSSILLTAFPENYDVAQAEGLENRIASRINNNQGDVVQPPYRVPWDPKVIFYPDWMFGEWNVKSTLQGVLTPLGKDYVPPGFLEALDSESDTSEYSYKLRFYKTLPDTPENNLRFVLGLGQPRGAVIADKAFNTMQMTNAFLGYNGAVRNVEYDVRNSPLRQTVTLSTLGPDLAPLPPRRLELFINSLGLEKDGENVFRTSELARQVFISVNNVQVSDYEVVNEYMLIKDGSITGRQRSFLYLQPQDPLFFKSNGKAVCVYDYGFTMEREPAGGGDPVGAQACVTTPKQVTQCL